MSSDRYIWRSNTPGAFRSTPASSVQPALESAPVQFATAATTGASAKIAVDRKAQDKTLTASLFDAVRSKDRGQVASLLEHGADLNALDDEGNTPFHCAIGNQDFYTAKLLKERGAAIDQPNHKGVTPLMTAADNGDHVTLEDLLKWGAQPNAVSQSGKSALVRAARKGCLSSVQALCKGGADVNLSQKNGWTALHVAAYYGHLQVVRELLRQGAAIDARLADDADNTPFLLAASRGHVDVAAFLRQRGCNTRSRIEEHCSAMEYACLGGKTEMVEALYEWCLLPESPVGRLRIMTAACFSNDRKLLKRLIEMGCEKLSGTDIPVSSCVEHNCDQTMAQLLEWGLPPDSTCVMEGKAAAEVPHTALWWAVSFGHVETARVLLQGGASLRHPSHGQPLLCLAAASGNVAMMALLCEAGAEVDSLVDNQPTPLMAAAQRGQLKAVQWLLSQNASAGLAPLGEESPISLAAINGHADVVRLLRKHIQAFNPSALGMKTSMSAAIDMGHANIVEVLLELGHVADLASLQRAVDAENRRPALIDQLQIHLNLLADPLGQSNPDAAQQFVADLLKAFRDGLGRPNQFSHWLSTRGICAVLWPLVNEVLVGLKEALPLLAPEGHKLAREQELICCAILLATMHEPNYARFYEGQQLSQQTVALLTAQAQARFAALVASANLVLQALCFPKIERLAGTCVQYMGLGFEVSPALATSLNAQAGLLPPVAARVVACWTSAAEQGRQTLRVEARAADLQAWVEDKLQPLFVERLGRVGPIEGFYDKRPGAARSQAYHAILVQQLDFIEQYRQSFAQARTSASAFGENFV